MFNYTDVSGRNHPDNLEYTILGKYRSFMDDKNEIVDLMSTVCDLEFDMNDDVEAAKQHLCELREKIHLDVYGRPKYEEIGFVVDLIQTDDNAILLSG